MHINLVDLINETVGRLPEKLAAFDTEKKFTFAQLYEAFIRVASFIHPSLKNQPVAVILPKNVDALIACVGVLYSGNFYVPLDPDIPATRLTKIISDLEPALIITDENYLAVDTNYHRYSDGTLFYFQLATGPAPTRLPHGDKNGSRDITGGDPAYCIYTSGSTGKPKGVVISHQAVLDVIEWADINLHFDETTIIGNQASFFFDLSVIDIYLCFKTGAALCLIPKYLFSFPTELLNFLSVNNINSICWVPSALSKIANQGALKNSATLPNLEQILFIGEEMPAKTLNHWQDFFPEAFFCNMYGPTESTFCSAFFIITDRIPDHDKIPIGYACQNTKILVLNEQGEHVGVNEIGELCIGGISLAFGYWRDPEATALSFRQNPLNTNFSETLYFTGDLVRIAPNGELYFCGRKDNQIKHKGYRIELSDIETAVNSMGNIEQSCVLYDSGNEEIVLIYSTKSNEEHESLIFTRLADLLPNYMLPTKFVRQQGLPLNVNGKIDRVKLSLEYKSGV